MEDITLAQYKGKKVRVICLDCDLLKTFDGTELLSQYGNANMPGLLDTLHTLVGCERPKAGFCNRCSLTYHIGIDEWIRRAGMVSRDDYEIALGKRLSDLKEWEVPEARCECGRRGKLNRNSLMRKHGRDARIKDLAHLVFCQGCKKYDSVIEISQLPR